MKKYILTPLILVLFLSIHTVCLIAGTCLQDTTIYDIILAKDGNGDYIKVQDAINDAPDNSSCRTVIIIKPGTYKEKLVIPAEKKN